jgi:hypothetical protein
MGMTTPHKRDDETVASKGAQHVGVGDDIKDNRSAHNNHTTVRSGVTFGSGPVATSLIKEVAYHVPDNEYDTKEVELEKRSVGAAESGQSSSYDSQIIMNMMASPAPGWLVKDPVLAARTLQQVLSLSNEGEGGKSSILTTATSNASSPQPSGRPSFDSIKMPAVETHGHIDEKTVIPPRDIVPLSPLSSTTKRASEFTAYLVMVIVFAAIGGFLFGFDVGELVTFDPDLLKCMCHNAGLGGE